MLAGNLESSTSLHKMTIGKSILTIAALAALAAACQSDYSYGGGDRGVDLSADTVSFDTVYSDAATAAASIKVYNRSSSDMTVASIALAGGEASAFEVNINGQAACEARGLRLASGDSLYVFVRLRAGANGSSEPVEMLDSVVVTTARAVQRVVLRACSQDVVRLADASLGTMHLTADRPYLVTGTLTVDSAAVLTVDAGARIYFAGDASMLVHGRLEVCGTPDRPALFATHRREAWYADLPGQWQGIELAAGSSASLAYATVANAVTALRIDSAATADALVGCRLMHASRDGLHARCARVDLTNTLVANCGRCLVLVEGGRCRMLHCTLANYQRRISRLAPSLYVSDNWLADDGTPVCAPVESLEIINSIVYGTMLNELTLDMSGETDEPVTTVRNSLLRLGSAWADTEADSRFEATIVNSDPLFSDTDGAHFGLTADSPARDAADPASALPVDIRSIARFADGQPDMGAFEFEVSE